MGKKRDVKPALRKQALKAVQDGQLSVEELLDEALQRSAAFEQWLGSRLKEARDQEPRSLQVQKVAALPAPVIERALDLARQRFSGFSGVRHITWGVKHAKGRATACDAVVILVEEKRRAMRKGAPERIPASLSFSFEAKRYRVATDVRAYARGGVKQALHPGNQCGVVTSGNMGTLSAVVGPERGVWWALLSGHVAERKGAGVIARADTGHELDLGRVQKCRNDVDVDAALAGPIKASLIPYLARGPARLKDLPLNAPRLRLKLLLRKGEVTAFVDSVSEPVDFGPPYAPQPMRGLIRLDGRRSNDGDSGAPALDMQGRIIGFVVGCAASGETGAREHTYLLPTRRALDGLI
jgi:hypothetical protein